MSITSEDIKKLRIKTGAGMMDCKKALDETNDIEKAVEWLRKKGINTAQKKSERSATDGLITIKIEDNTGVILEINSETDFVAKNEHFQEFCENTSTLCVKNKIQNIDDLFESSFENSDNNVKVELTNLISKLGENIVIKKLKLVNDQKLKLQKYLHNSVSENSGKLGVLLSFDVKEINSNVSDLSKQICMHIAATEPKSVDIDSLDSSLILKEKNIYKEQLKSSGKPDDIIEKIIDGKIKKFYEDVCLLEQLFVIDNKKKIKDIISEFNKNNNLDFNINNYLIFKLGL
ncbi:MAG: translation elongation factor Ts [Rickettsiales bacterium]|nr:translation elongation factor Ts [Rickettsiales bacterium]RPG16238.1 MAG: translation elongation factor Ts [Pelagibacteraceae bacterium TMED195]|tara:strand:+ start:1355 stop:2221 length:867 start_codon:yes stop_codon:yes gene_type:complete